MPVEKDYQEFYKNITYLGHLNSSFPNLSVADNINFESSMRQFYTNPTTTIPNSQDNFLKYCYSKLHSEKPLFVY